MANDLNYQIFPSVNEPKTVEYTIADWRRRDNFLVNMYMVGLFVLAIMIMIGIQRITAIFIPPMGDPSAGGATPLAFLASLVGSIYSVILISRRLDKARIPSIENEIRAERYQKEEVRAYEEAKSLTSSVSYIYESSIGLASELSEHIKEASLWLEDAEGEYEETAFSSFWDSIEDAARHLADYQKKLGKITKNAQEYYHKLSNRKHTFPSFPVTNGTIPDASFVMSEFNRVVRLGQTNFQFASIWEQRKTRAVLIAGFRSLGEAVSSLAYEIQDSMSEFQESISSNEARIVEEGIKTREVLTDAGKKIDKRLLEQNRMLDNIQHGRKPKFKDIPSKKGDNS